MHVSVAAVDGSFRVVEYGCFSWFVPAADQSVCDRIDLRGGILFTNFESLASTNTKSLSSPRPYMHKLRNIGAFHEISNCVDQMIVAIVVNAASPVQPANRKPDVPLLSECRRL
jgi:hypothetical protein